MGETVDSRPCVCRRAYRELEGNRTIVARAGTSKKRSDILRLLYLLGQVREFSVPVAPTSSRCGRPLGVTASTLRDRLPNCYRARLC